MSDHQAEPTTALGWRLRRSREAKGWTPNDLAEKSGVSQPTVWRIETGATPSPGVKTLEMLADALGTSVQELLGQDRPPDQATHHGATVAAGAPGGGDQDDTEEEAPTLHSFRVSGDCMRGTIDHGDEVLVELIDDPHRLPVGKIALFRHDGELLCKRISKLGGQVVLFADDGTAFHADETTHLIGVVRKIVKNAP